MTRFVGSPAVEAGPPDPPPDVLSVTITSTTTLVTGTISGKDWHGRASVVTRSGVVVMFWRDGTAHNVNDGALHVKFSNDYGATWTATDTKIGGGAVTGFPMNPSTLDSGEDAGEPWAIIAPSGDVLLFMWRVNYFNTRNGTWMSRSTDGGNTWSSSTGPIEFADATATSDTQTRTFATDDGFLLGSVIYICGRIYTSTALNAANFCLFKSTDDGVTWSRVSLMATVSEAGGKGILESGLERVGATTFLAMLRDFNQTHSYKRISTDSGLTWGTLIDVTTPVGIAGRQRVYTIDHLQGNANWWLDNRLLMVGYYYSGGNRTNAVWISLDSGGTWTTPYALDSAATDGGYGDVFWDATHDQYVVVSYKGPALTSADLKQYRLTITGMGS